MSPRRPKANKTASGKSPSRRSSAPRRSSPPDGFVAVILSPFLLLPLFFLLVGLGYFFWSRDHLGLAWSCFIAAMGVTWKVRIPSKVVQTPLFLFAVLAGIMLVFGAAYSVPSMTRYLPSVPAFHVPLVWPAALAGTALLSLCFACFREDASAKMDIGPWTARFWLAVILAVSAWMRLHQLDQPFSGYAFDSAISMLEGRNVLDFPEHRQLFFYEAAFPPTQVYPVALGYALFPHLSTIVLQKMICTLMNLLVLWVFYLLGKEISGRRTGLFLAMALAISKCWVVTCMAGIPDTVSLGIGVLLLFTFRYIYRSDLKHALEWGLTVALAAYCYTTMRPYLWLVPLAVLGVILWRYRGNRQPFFWALGLGVPLVWTYLFFFVNRFLPSWMNPNRWILVFLVTLLVFFLYELISEPGRDAGARELSTSLIGLVFAVLLFYPLVSNTSLAEYASNFSIFNANHPAHPKGGVTLGYLLDRGLVVLDALFQGVPDNPLFSFPGEAYFGVPSALWIALGVAWWISAPRWKETFLVFCVGVGILPYLLSFDGSTGRLGGMIPPLFMLGALGMEALWRRAQSLPGGSFWTALALVGLLFYGKWSVETLNYRYEVLWPQQPYNDEFVFEQIRKDAPFYRIYLWPDSNLCSDHTLSVLVDEGEDLYEIGPEGAAIPSFAGKKMTDVVVYANANDKDVLKRIGEQYPRAKVEEVVKPGGSSAPFLDKCYIPGDALEKEKKAGAQPLFTLLAVPETAWRCRFYKFQNGLGHGVIRKEDWLTGAWGPLPDALPLETAVVEGTIQLPREGAYQFSVKGGNFAVVEVDGRGILDYRPPANKVPQGQVRKISLLAGEHRVVLRTYFQEGMVLPPVSVRFPGETMDRVLGSF